MVLNQSLRHLWFWTTPTNWYREEPTWRQGFKQLLCEQMGTVSTKTPRCSSAGTSSCSARSAYVSDSRAGGWAVRKNGVKLHSIHHGLNVWCTSSLKSLSVASVDVGFFIKDVYGKLILSLLDSGTGVAYWCQLLSRLILVLLHNLVNPRGNALTVAQQLLRKLESLHLSWLT